MASDEHFNFKFSDNFTVPMKDQSIFDEVITKRGTLILDHPL